MAAAVVVRLPAKAGVLFGGTRDDRHVGALRRELLSDGSADPPAGAGDHDAPARETTCHLPAPRPRPMTSSNSWDARWLTPPPASPVPEPWNVPGKVCSSTGTPACKRRCA